MGSFLNQSCNSNTPHVMEKGGVADVFLHRRLKQQLLRGCATSQDQNLAPTFFPAFPSHSTLEKCEQKASSGYEKAKDNTNLTYCACIIARVKTLHFSVGPPLKKNPVNKVNENAPKVFSMQLLFLIDSNLNP